MTNTAQIYDQGYRTYDGPRTGVPGAIRAVVKQSLRHSLGLGRSAVHKILPLAIVMMAYIPAVVFVGLAVLIPVDVSHRFLPSYAQYYGFVAATIYLLAGLVGPELLCADRRTGMLGVYLASPLSRNTYLISKALSVFIMLLLVTLGPPVLMLIAFSLQDVGPNGFVDWISTFVKIVIASAVVGVFYTAVSLAVAAFTDRRAMASATIMAIIPGSGIFTDRLVLDADLSPWFRMANLLFLPRAIVFRVFRESEGWPAYQNSTLSLWTAFAVIVGSCVLLIWYRYRTLLVTK